jgi:phytanoyl-CoA hydroxylase
VGAQEEPYYQQGGEEPAAATPELRVRKLWKFADVDRTLGAAVAAPRMMAIVDQLVGSGARLIQDMALMKPPHRGAEKPWHQDNAYFDWTPLDGVLGVWIALDPATVENGCMQIVPGSHRAGPVPHYHVRDCQLVDQTSRADRAEVVPLRPGGALFFSALLHHGTPPNRSAERRRALQFHYAAARCRRMTFSEHMTHFALDGAYVGCRDWDMQAGVSRARLLP